MGKVAWVKSIALTCKTHLWMTIFLVTNCLLKNWYNVQYKFGSYGNSYQVNYSVLTHISSINVYWTLLMSHYFHKTSYTCIIVHSWNRNRNGTFQWLQAASRGLCSGESELTPEEWLEKLHQRCHFRGRISIRDYVGKRPRRPGHTWCLA